MNPFRKLALTLVAALAFFAGDAMAQCSGKTVYVELPSDWTKTSVYIKSDNMTTITATNNGKWTIFTFPATQEFTDAGKSFALSKQAAESGTNNWINQTQYNFVGQAGTRISCNASTFNSDGIVYIYPNPSNSSATAFSKEPPSAKYFYFLPPNDKDWIMGAPYLWDGSTITAMEIDPNRCGWYRVVYSSSEPPDRDMLILQSRKDTDPNSFNKIGYLGMAEDPIDWVDGIPTAFKLKSIFDDRFSGNCPVSGCNLFFVADGASMGWHTLDPMITERERCSYNFAAII